MRRLTWLLIPVLLLTACFGTKIRKTQLILYFDTQAAAGQTAQPSFPVTMAVREIQLAPLYDNAKVVKRLGDYTVDYSAQGAWALRPNLMVQDLLVDYLKQKALFKQVIPHQGPGSADYTISGKILAIEEDLRPSPREAVLGLEFKVQSERSRRLLLEKQYRKNLACKGPGYEALAQAWSQALQAIYGEFSRDLRAALQAESAAGGAAAPETKESEDF